MSANGFVLSLLSPVWRAKLSGAFGKARHLDLEVEDEPYFASALALGCGAAVALEGGMEALLALALMADKYQVSFTQSKNPTCMAQVGAQPPANTPPMPRDSWRR